MPSNARDTGNSILNQVENRPKFCQRRDLAFTRPERARDKLQSYSTLELKVVKARNLLATDIVASDPYTEVYLDDVLKDQTQVVVKHLNPAWNWEKTLEIKHPASVLLLRVMDYDLGDAPDMLGFVEFPVVDLPLNVRTTGWFRLAPAEELVGKATDRLQKMAEHREETCGALYLEVTRRIVSGDPEDESYAWCLPQPECHEYPDSGWTRRKLDAQALIDSIMDFKSTLLGGLVRPMLSGVGFVLGWRHIPTTAVALAVGVGVSIRPEYFMSGLFLMAGLTLLLLSDPVVCAAMALQPATVPLTDDGYKLIAQTSDTDAAASYLGRVLSTIQGKVLDEDKLREFAAFSSFEGQAVADSYADFKQQLHRARKGGDSKHSFFKTDEKPLPKGALVQRWGQKGEIVQCVNPSEVLTWKYEVHFEGAEKPEVVIADELDPRTDMRWMSGDAVLALIPNSVEDSLVGWTIFFRSMTTTLKGVEQPIRDIAGWKDKVKSLSVALGCLAISVLFAWTQRVFFFAAVLLLFAKNTEMWIAFFAKRRGKAASEKQATAKTMSEWGFYTQAEEAAAQERGILQSWMESAKSTFGK